MVTVRNNNAIYLQSEELMEIQYSLKSASCAALMELVLNDANGQHIILANGLYYLGLLILPPCKQCVGKERKWAKNLQRNAFRALRFTFSMERNRRLFKRLFPPDLFDMFISVGHYIKDLSAYKTLVEKINSYRVSLTPFFQILYVNMLILVICTTSNSC